MPRVGGPCTFRPVCFQHFFSLQSLKARCINFGFQHTTCMTSEIVDSGFQNSAICSSAIPKSLTPGFQNSALSTILKSLAPTLGISEHSALEPFAILKSLTPGFQNSARPYCAAQRAAIAGQHMPRICSKRPSISWHMLSDV